MDMDGANRTRMKPVPNRGDTTILCKDRQMGGKWGNCRAGKHHVRLLFSVFSWNPTGVISDCITFVR